MVQNTVQRKFMNPLTVTFLMTASVIIMEWVCSDSCTAALCIVYSIFEYVLFFMLQIAHLLSFSAKIETFSYLLETLKHPFLIHF